MTKSHFHFTSAGLPKVVTGGETSPAALRHPRTGPCPSMTTRVSPPSLPPPVSRHTVHSTTGTQADGAEHRRACYSHVLSMTLSLRGPDIKVGLRLNRAYGVVYLFI